MNRSGDHPAATKRAPRARRWRWGAGALLHTREGEDPPGQPLHHLGLWVLLQLGVWVVVGVVLGRDLLLFGKVLSFIS